MSMGFCERFGGSAGSGGALVTGAGVSATPASAGETSAGAGGNGPSTTGAIGFGAAATGSCFGPHEKSRSTVPARAAKWRSSEWRRRSFMDAERSLPRELDAELVTRHQAISPGRYHVSKLFGRAK